MSTENVDIVVTEKGSSTAASNIERVGTSAVRAAGQVDLLNSAFAKLRTILATVGFATGAKELLDYADTHAKLVNQIRQTVESSTELTEVYEKLFKMSQETRTSFARNVDTYKSLKESTRDFGTTSEQITQVLRVLNQVMVADGASAEEVSGALRMLQFAMSTGTVEGRGLRAVLMQFPDLGRLIASELGVTTKQLKEMGDNGQLTTQKLLAVLTSASAAARAQEAFGRVHITVSQALTILNNAITRFIGEMDQANGITAALSGAILFVANHLQQLVSILLQVGGAFAAIKLAQWGAAAVVAVAGVVRTVYALGTALLFLRGPAQALGAVITIATGGLNLLIPLIGAAVAWTLQYGQAVKLTEDGSISLRGVVVGTWNYIIDAISRAYTAIVEWFQTSALGQAMVEVLTTIVGWLKSAYEYIIKFLEAIGLVSNEGGGELDKLKKSIADASSETKKLDETWEDTSIKMIRGTQGMVGGGAAVIGVTNGMSSAFTDAGAKIISVMDGSSTAVQDFAKVAEKSFDEIAKDAFDAAASAEDAFSNLGSSGGSASHTISSGGETTGGVDFATNHILSSVHKGGTGFSTSQDQNPAFAGGGEFTVGGHGGTDSQLVKFYATPGEKVSVQTPAQQGAAAGGGRTVVHAPITVYAQDAASFTKSQKTIAMQLQSKLTRAARSIG